MTDFTFETLMSQNVKKTDLLVFFVPSKMFLICAAILLELEKIEVRLSLIRHQNSLPKTISETMLKRIYDEH